VTELDKNQRTLHIALGNHVKEELEFLDEIPLLDSGKHRYTISEVVESEARSDEQGF
jgi:hypothetical protein